MLADPNHQGAQTKTPALMSKTVIKSTIIGHVLVQSPLTAASLHVIYSLGKLVIRLLVEPL